MKIKVRRAPQRKKPLWIGSHKNKFIKNKGIGRFEGLDICLSKAIRLNLSVLIIKTIIKTCNAPQRWIYIFMEDNRSVTGRGLGRRSP